MAKIGILVASSDNNQKLGLKLQELAQKENCEVELINLVDLKLPLYCASIPNLNCAKLFLCEIKS